MQVGEGRRWLGVILAGGQGTRLAALNLGLPKPMLPLAGRPLVEHIAGWLLRALPKVVVLAGRNQPIFDHFAGHDRIEPLAHDPAGTGGDVLALARSNPATTLVVCNADTVNDLDLAAVLAAHLTRSPSVGATLVVTRSAEAQYAGAIAVDQSGRVIRSFEDGQGGPRPQPGAAWQGSSTGVLVVDTALLADLSFSGDTVSLERQVIPALIERGQVFACDNGQRLCLDIGLPETYPHLINRAGAALAALGRHWDGVGGSHLERSE
ncbi:putative MobA-like NTP transferase domain-containing protein [uncultured Gammaproteobacteria bacterium]